MNSVTGCDFIHVGIVKTGSTWLQTGFFVQHPELQVVGHGKLPFPQFTSLMHEIVPDHDRSLQIDMLDWARRFEQTMIQHRTDVPKFGISNENLTGRPLRVKDAYWLAEQLRATFGPTRIIIVFRHPLTFLTSTYAEDVASRQQRVHLKTLLKRPDSRREIALRLDYLSLLNHYKALFGEEQVLVLPYEFLLASNDRFLQHICDFLDIMTLTVSEKSVDRRPSFSGVTTEALRWANISGRVLRKVGLLPHNNTITRILVNFLRQRGGPRVFPKMKNLPIEYLRQYQELDELLREENYAFWTGELAQFNYTFYSR